MLFRIDRAFSVDPPVPGQGQIVERLKERLASDPLVDEVSAVAELGEEGVERIRVIVVVDASSIADAGALVRKRIRPALEALGVPRKRLRLAAASGSHVRNR